MSTNDGGPAFPGLHPSKECRFSDPGMSLRDAFAMNVVGHIVGAVFADQQTGGLMQRKPDLVQGLMEGLAIVAYGVADQMLKARGTP